MSSMNRERFGMKLVNNDHDRKKRQEKSKTKSKTKRKRKRNSDSTSGSDSDNESATNTRCDSVDKRTSNARKRYGDCEDENENVSEN